MTSPLLEFGPGEPVKRYSIQLAGDRTTYMLKNPANHADAVVSVYGNNGGQVFPSVEVTAETVKIEVGKPSVGEPLRVVLIG